MMIELLQATESPFPPKKSATWAAMQMLRGYQRIAGLASDRGKISLSIGRRRAR